MTSGWAGVTLQKLHQTLTQRCGVNLTGVIVMPKHYAEKEIPAKLVACSHNNQNVVLHEGGFSDLLEQMGGDWEKVKNSGKVHVVLEEGM